MSGKQPYEAVLSSGLVSSSHTIQETVTSWSTLPKSNMTGWKITIFKRRYIFKWLVFHCHVSELGGVGGVQPTPTTIYKDLVSVTKAIGTRSTCLLFLVIASPYHAQREPQETSNIIMGLFGTMIGMLVSCINLKNINWIFV